MKLGPLLRGKRAERPAMVPVETGPEGSATEVAVLLVPLSGAEEGEAIAFARAYATKRGAKEPKPGDPDWDLGYMAKRIELGVLDPDSPADARTRTFGAVEEVLDLPRETLAFLYGIQDAWQDECSPSVRALTDAALHAAVKKLADGGSESADFLSRLSPGTQWRLLLFMAGPAWTSLERKSSSSPT